jgi:decaprenyl-phosphate phosphoribosyltransferase
MRPLEWSKSFGNMAIAAVTAHFVAGVQLDWQRFIIGFAALALLWGGLYALNDYTDRHADAMHPVKKRRAIPCGSVPANVALVFSLGLILAALAIGLYLNSNCLFPLCLLVMLANQLMYTTPPFNFKKRPIVDLVSGSLINPVFRFYSGWVLFVPAFNAPLITLLFILGIQFGGFGLYRMASKDHEKKLGLRSTVVLYGEKKLRRAAYVAILAGGLSYVAASLTILPIAYLIWGIIMVLPAPMYKDAMKRPQDANIRRMYWTLYLHYLVFILGFIAFSFFY